MFHMVQSNLKVIFKFSYSKDIKKKIQHGVRKVYYARLCKKLYFVVPANFSVFYCHISCGECVYLIVWVDDLIVIRKIVPKFLS